MLQRLLFWTIAAPMDEKTAPFGTVLVYAEDDALASHLGRGLSVHYHVTNRVTPNGVGLPPG